MRAPPPSIKPSPPQVRDAHDLASLLRIAQTKQTGGSTLTRLLPPSTPSHLLLARPQRHPRGGSRLHHHMLAAADPSDPAKPLLDEAHRPLGKPTSDMAAFLRA